MNLFLNIRKIPIFIGILFSFELASANSLALFNPQDIPQDNLNIYINSQVILANDAFSLKSILNNFTGDFDHKSSEYFTLGDIRYDMGIYSDKIGYIGYVYRKEVAIKTSSDAMLLMNQSKKKLGFTVGKDYNLYLEGEGFEVHGITWANNLLYRKNEWSFNLWFGVELLYSTEMQELKIQGEATATAEKDYDFTWNSHNLYTENYLYDLDVDKATSYGYSTHIALYTNYKNLSLSIIGNDINGKLYWKNVPYSNVTMSSATKSYDSNGYVKYASMISGMESTTKFTQTLMPKWRIDGAYKFNKKHQLNFGTEYIYSTYLPYISYTHLFDEVSLTTSYESYFGMFGVGINYKGYSFGIQSNKIDEPSAMRINLGINYNF